MLDTIFLLSIRSLRYNRTNMQNYKINRYSYNQRDNEHFDAMNKSQRFVKRTFDVIFSSKEEAKSSAFFASLSLKEPQVKLFANLA